ncbi:hypothetical protein MKK88_14950 [Methylobacterium sp. E-005]|uniref:hypothetical protein n=1 Tax=Methylobacterium sp. E-005 TaxID=2836549 RepID=UPI001FB889C6|nr:hypothetical protein [Methylobacterium sp. E-005]MCJ2087273.1 hypothetical protein [Methylobacterium sp. E-005]
MKPGLIQTIDGFRILRDACSEAARNLGLATELERLSPEHWQRVLTAVEIRTQTLGINLPDGWRKELAAQMGRDEPDAFIELES